MQRMMCLGVWAGTVVALMVGGLVRGQAGKPQEPVYEASRIVQGFARDYKFASQDYESRFMTVTGRIKSISFEKNDKGVPTAHIMLVPKQQMQPEIALDIRVTVAPGDGSDKAEPGDLVALGGVRFAALPMEPGDREISIFVGKSFKLVAHEVTPGVRADDLNSWLKANNAFGGGTNDFVEQMMDAATKHTQAGEDFTLTFGPGLMKSGKATMVGMVDGKMFAVPLTDGQAKQKKLEQMTVVDAPAGRSSPVFAPEVTFQMPVFEGGMNWNASRPLKGKVKMTALDPRRLAATSDKYALRMVNVAGSHRVELFAYLTKYSGEYPVSFELSPEEIKDLKAEPKGEARVEVFEIVRMVDRAPGDLDAEVISDAKVMILNVTAK